MKLSGALATKIIDIDCQLSSPVPVPLPALAPTPAPDPTPAPAADDPEFDPDHPFSFGDDWAIRVPVGFERV